MSVTFSLTDWLHGVRTDVDAFLAPAFQDAWPPSFAEPLRYPVFGGGKRARPALCLAAYEAVAPGLDRRVALPAAAAVELVHTYSLVHDDLPAMDDDAERRGRPTVHIVWDDATAILSGDALLTHAFTVLAEAEQDPATTVQLIARLAQASGYRGMVGGQVGDIAGATADLDHLTNVHRMKTGALLQASAWMGARAAGASTSELERMDRFGAAVGLAFQLADDILDLEEDLEGDGPPSFATLLGEEETRRRANELAEEAYSLAASFEQPEALLGLARFFVERDV